MTKQARHEAQGGATLWQDGPAAGDDAPAGTVAQDQPARDAAATAPPHVTAALLARGQDRYRIFCTPCHAETGDGQGRVVQRGFPRPPAFGGQDNPRRTVDVITRGYGVMYPSPTASIRPTAGRSPPMSRRSRRFRGRAHEAISLLVALAGAAALAALAIVDPRSAADGWRAGFLLLSAPPIGAVALLLIARVVGADWDAALMPMLAALPWLGFLAIPVVIGQALFHYPDGHLHLWLSPIAFTRAIGARAAVLVAGRRARCAAGR